MAVIRLALRFHLNQNSILYKSEEMTRIRSAARYGKPTIIGRIWEEERYFTNLIYAMMMEKLHCKPNLSYEIKQLQ